MLFSREINADYRGFRILVQNSWATGVIPALISEGFGAARKALGDETRLLIDGKVVDLTKAWILSPKSALVLQTSLDQDKDRYVVTVYAKASLFRNLLKLCVNGERIAGDDF